MTSYTEDLLCEVILFLTGLVVGWGTYLFFAITHKFLDQDFWEDPTEVNLEIEQSRRNNKGEIDGWNQ